jgi:tetratricopeptide (TPR) repeat protein
VIFSALSLARSGRAQDVSPTARAHFQRGLAAYEHGQFREAIEAFREADTLAPSAQLSFDVARCEERLGNARRAIAAYRTYLQRLPSAHNRTEVEQRIARLEAAAQGSTPAAPAAAPALALTPAAPTPSSTASAPATLAPSAPAVSEVSPARTAAPRWWTWTALGGSAALLLGAAGLEWSRARWEERARESRVQIEHQRQFQAMERRQTAARVLLGLGAATFVASGVSLYFDLSQRSAPLTRAVLDCAPTGCLLAAGGRF